MKKKPDDIVSVMIVDDEPVIRDAFAHHLVELGHEVRSFSSGESCFEAFRENPADILITDLRMPGMDGLALLKKVKSISASTEMILVTAHADKDVAIDAVKLGVFDFFEKPVSLDHLAAAIERTARYQVVVRERDRLSAQIKAMYRRDQEMWGVGAFVGRSEAICQTLKQIVLLQRVRSTSVLLQGESGTGKELVARAIHFGGSRSSAPFVPVNCSALPSELVESTLFGHTKGAFTGATSDKKGSFSLADGGTLFLDEIGDMPAFMQTKLLRVLEDGIVMPVGGTKPIEVDVRVIAATNADLESKLTTGGFREDLYYRLAGYTIVIPPLRERKSDVQVLTDHFVDSLAAEMGMTVPEIDPDVLDVLNVHSFPGNVRELRNVIERALIECEGGPIRTCHIHLRKPAGPVKGKENEARLTTPAHHGGEIDNMPVNLREAEAILIRRAMTMTNGNMSAAARDLGIDRAKLYRMLASTSDMDVQLAAAM